MRLFVALAGVLTMVQVSLSCPGLSLYEPLEIVRPYGPTGRWSGHFGMDLAVPAGSVVRSVGSGTVTFAGVVAGRRSVTVDHGGGIRTSYSYLTAQLVSTGRRVGRGSPLGYSGIHDGRAAVHLSLRKGVDYMDPLALTRCSLVPHPGLWLASSLAMYPGQRERNPRRHIRSSTLRTSCGRPRGARATRARYGASHGGR